MLLAAFYPVNPGPCCVVNTVNIGSLSLVYPLSHTMSGYGYNGYLMLNLPETDSTTSKVSVPKDKILRWGYN
ncbi:hypothetical protein K435DRAFT_296694 [Dendrothele bispora CBS 962.96]|uniref:Uncharacterized protein n=1 Tax=Dendrothele bispora (strain CBS 962.96) TaxID=1314807 RepID=A0A4S8LJL6_DENBC|nr:hypothetical protein K435DRAFT_296694 [Dendrothele bispora CBS 962.96]